MWPTGLQGTIITTVVQFGGRSVTMYAFRWSGGTLQLVREWGGENFAVDRLEGKLAITVHPIDYTQVPELYVWNGTDFTSAESPDFYASLVKTYIESMLRPDSPPEAVVENCGLALQAAKRADLSGIARLACKQAQARIPSSQVDTKHTAGRTPEQIRKDKDHAVAQISERLKESQAPY